MPLDPHKIRTRREALKLSQAKAAELAGISQPHWHLVESGERPDPALSTAEKIARALGVTVARLLVS